MKSGPGTPDIGDLAITTEADQAIESLIMNEDPSSTSLLLRFAQAQ